MGIMSWDLEGGFNKPVPLRVGTPRLTIRCEYPDTDMPPTEVTFGLSPAYDIRNARWTKTVDTKTIDIKTIDTRSVEGHILT